MSVALAGFSDCTGQRGRAAGAGRNENEREGDDHSTRSGQLVTLTAPKGVRGYRPAAPPETPGAHRVVGVVQALVQSLGLAEPGVHEVQSPDRGAAELHD
jgi:phosphatidylethanolamine-binding protein (PEBP) family uncharacterized protein